MKRQFILLTTDRETERVESGGLHSIIAALQQTAELATDRIGGRIETKRPSKSRQASAALCFEGP
jgi:hypothetical protein